MGLMLFIYFAGFVSSFIFIIKIFLGLTIGVLLLSLYILVFELYASKTNEGETKYNDFNKILKWMKGLLISIITMSILLIITPSERTMYIMAGAYLGQEIVTNEIVSDKLNKVNEIIDLKLNEILSELNSENKEIK